MKKVAIMQPYLFPYIGYWQLINAVDVFVIYDDVNFINKGFINRNYILFKNRSQRFTLELRKASQNKLINEIEIGNNQKKILKTIEFAYKRAPFFDVIFPLIEELLSWREKNLAKFTTNSLVKVGDFLKIKTKFVVSSNIKKDNSLKRQSKIIEIVKKLKGDIYINSIGGTSLYNKNDFARENIELKFLKPLEIKYKQFNNEFIPNLSIIDTMMFNSPEKIKNEFLEKYELI